MMLHQLHLAMFSAGFHVRSCSGKLKQSPSVKLVIEKLKKENLVGLNGVAPGRGPYKE